MINRITLSLLRCITGVSIRTPAPQRTPGTPRIYYANHSSHLDIILIRAALPFGQRRLLYTAAAADYWGKTRLHRWIATGLLNAVLIERKNVTRANNPIKALSKILAEGHDVLIFPEGKRNDAGTALEFKSGLWHLAKSNPNAEVIPVLLENASRVLPKGDILPVPLICSVNFGQKPLPYSDSCDDYIKQATNLINNLDC